MLYTYYADDFTGSTDVLEQLTSNGVPAVLFLRPPTPEDLAAFPNIQAIGIAGDARSRSPQWMDTHLPPIYRLLQSFAAPITHYKVCSTFDSSPTHGSIGRAIELALPIFTPTNVLIVVGAPHLSRYVHEGRLFALAPDGLIHRIDRHPMAHHPVTPMRQPDLRAHLALQLTHPDTLSQITLFDTTSKKDLADIGDQFWHQAQTAPIFSASSSGLTTALISAWRKLNLIPPPPDPKPIPPASPLLVLSGSCSPATANQIRYALAHSYKGIPIDPTTLAANRTQILEAATSSLAQGQDTILYTSLGPTQNPAQGDQLGKALGTLLRDLLPQTPVTRVLLCGGDTSSHAIQQLNLTALTWVATLQPGAPLCQAHPTNLELVLKGGQIGTEDFFLQVRGSMP